jgi:hypothetical protein
MPVSAGHWLPAGGIGVRAISRAETQDQAQAQRVPLSHLFLLAPCCLIPLALQAGTMSASPDEL